MPVAPPLDQSRGASLACGANSDRSYHREFLKRSVGCGELNKMSQGFHGDLTLYSYVSQRTHRYLSEDAWRIEGPNIGSMGEHLTITFLNVDQCGLSERLCSSIAREIPHF